MVLASWLLDLLYPPSCALCGVLLSRGRGLCAGCADRLPELEPPFCACCGRPFDGVIERPVSCPNCDEMKVAFEFARPARRRDSGVLELIHRVKYQRQLHLAGELGRLAQSAIQDGRVRQAVDDGWPLVPVPLHRGRLRWRHFNQAAEIARQLSSAWGCPVLPALRRIRSTGTQTAFGRRMRLANLRGAFALTRRGRHTLAQWDRGVILIDDVLTTGATAHECARTLKRAGVKQVIVVTVMRG